MTTYLADSSVLIALTTDTHSDHERCLSWIDNSETFAMCPITQGAVTRMMLRNNHPLTTAQSTLRALEARPNWTLWPDDLSYATANLGDIHGHNQVTDAYLAALARAHNAKLATLDVGLAVTHPDVTILIP